MSNSLVRASMKKSIELYDYFDEETANIVLIAARWAIQQEKDPSA